MAVGRRIPCGAVAVRLTPGAHLVIIAAVMTPTLSRLFPPRRLALLCRAPFWAQAAVVYALFAIVGVAALDDYGVGLDEIYQRRTAVSVADYALGVSEEPPGMRYHDRYYGVAFEMPLLLVERALGLQDSRHIHLTRHLLSHLFFIAGGFACGMLAYRMLGSRWIALLAMLLFLLHPRLYAHSFFNSKDIPFAAMLVIALYLAHRAFRKDAIGAFLLCGIGVGLAINARPFGLMLLPMILAMRALDLWQAGRAERRRFLLTGAAFLAAALGTAYIVHPYYWENPLRFFDGLRVLSQHPTIAANLFMGEIYSSDAVPWNFIPVWFTITAPPVALALGAIGCAAACWQGVSRPLDALRDRETLFRILLLGCVVLPVAVVIALQSNIYNGWRQMYFLWGPFCLLAAVGLHYIANIRIGGGAWKVGARLPGWVRGGGRLHMAQRALAYGIAGVGLITTLTAMAALHPHQQVYFNALVDTKTPGALGKQYDMDYWEMAQRQSLEYLLARYPDGALRVWPGKKSLQILPQSDRERIPISRRIDAMDYYLHPIFMRRHLPEEPALHSIEAYGSVIAFILAPTSAAHRDYYRAEYGDAEANGTLLARAGFDIYAHNGALYYLKEDCGTLLSGADFRIFLHTFPADPADLPAHRREFGFENRDFWITEHFGLFEGKCIHRHILPDYPIARIRTGRIVEGKEIWRADIDLSADVAAQAPYERIAAGDLGARLYLHIIPANPANLPADSRERGFESADFRFAGSDARIDGRRLAARKLPGYP